MLPTLLTLARRRHADCFVMQSCTHDNQAPWLKRVDGVNRVLSAQHSEGDAKSPESAELEGIISTYDWDLPLQVARLCSKDIQTTYTADLDYIFGVSARIPRLALFPLSSVCFSHCYHFVLLSYRLNHRASLNNSLTCYSCGSYQTRRHRLKWMNNL